MQEASSKPRLIDSTKALGQRVRERVSGLTPHENIYTIPNILTFSRLLAAPAIGYLVLHDNHIWAAGLFAYAGISDLVDGWLARKYKLQTVVGSVIDPMADKALMTILVGCLAAKGALPRMFLSILLFI
jgi:cardiolipin synthase